MARFVDQGRWALLVTVTLIAVLALAIYAFRAQIGVAAAIENDRVVFLVQHRNVNGILKVRVLDGAETLWEIDTGYERGHRIVYGELPTGGNRPARQTVPSLGVPVPDIRGKEITVEVEYQFDRGVSACTDTLRKSIIIPAGGR
jgi:hypothetical protein